MKQLIGTVLAIKLVAASAISTLAMSTYAHDRHGLGSVHWHATDTLGVIAVAAGLMLAVWLGWGGK